MFPCTAVYVPSALRTDFKPPRAYTTVQTREFCQDNVHRACVRPFVSVGATGACSPCDNRIETWAGSTSPTRPGTSAHRSRSLTRFEGSIKRYRAAKAQWHRSYRGLVSTLRKVPACSLRGRSLLRLATVTSTLTHLRAYACVGKCNPHGHRTGSPRTTIHDVA